MQQLISDDDREVQQVDEQAHIAIYNAEQNVEKCLELMAPAYPGEFARQACCAPGRRHLPARK